MSDGLGPVRIAALLEHFGSAGRARRASQAELLRTSGIGPQLSASLAASLRSVDVDAEVERTPAPAAHLVALGQPEYPAWLASLPGAPRVLFLKGSILPADERAVALVGTRHPTAYGRKAAKSLAEGLARAGVTVVSGLARGIDGIAHRGALDGGGRTLAVLAGGLLRLYPPEHRTLADEVGRLRRGGDREQHGSGAAQGTVPGAQPHHLGPVAAWWSLCRRPQRAGH